MTRVSSHVFLQHVLQRERVDDRAEHAHVVGGDAIHAQTGAAWEPRTMLPPPPMTNSDSSRARHATASISSGPSPRASKSSPTRRPGERLAGELEQDARKAERHQASPIWKRTNRTTVAPATSCHELGPACVIAHPRLVEERRSPKNFPSAVDHLLDMASGLPLCAACASKIGARARSVGRDVLGATAIGSRGATCSDTCLASASAASPVAPMISTITATCR